MGRVTPEERCARWQAAARAVLERQDGEPWAVAQRRANARYRYVVSVRQLSQAHVREISAGSPDAIARAEAKGNDRPLPNAAPEIASSGNGETAAADLPDFAFDLPDLLATLCEEAHAFADRLIALGTEPRARVLARSVAEMVRRRVYRATQNA